MRLTLTHAESKPPVGCTVVRVGGLEKHPGVKPVLTFSKSTLDNPSAIWFARHARGQRIQQVFVFSLLLFAGQFLASQ
jgi:hypothetical protein